MMNDVDPPDPAPSPEEPAPRRSSFEDFEIPVPARPPAPLRRPAVLTTAAVVLIVAALMNALFLALFKPGGGGVWLIAAIAAAQAIAAVLILIRHPFGMPAGIVMGAVGIVLGIARAPADALSALMTMALSGFVIWAVASNGASFRRG